MFVCLIADDDLIITFNVTAILNILSYYNDVNKGISTFSMAKFKDFLFLIGYLQKKQAEL